MELRLIPSDSRKNPSGEIKNFDMVDKKLMACLQLMREIDERQLSVRCFIVIIIKGVRWISNVRKMSAISIEFPLDHRTSAQHTLIKKIIESVFWKCVKIKKVSQTTACSVYPGVPNVASDSWSDFFLSLILKLATIKSCNVKCILCSIGDLLMWQSTVMIFTHSRLEGRVVCENWFFYNLPWHFLTDHTDTCYSFRVWKIESDFSLLWSCPREDHWKFCVIFIFRLMQTFFFSNTLIFFSLGYLILLLVCLVYHYGDDASHIWWLRVERIILKCVLQRSFSIREFIEIMSVGQLY